MRMRSSGGPSEDLYETTQIDGGGGAADIASSGMMMSGNPYLMGASMGLKALSAASEKRRKEFEAKKAGQSKAFDAYTRAINMMA